MVQTSTMKTLKSSLPVSLFSSRSSNQSPLLFMAGIALQYCLKMHTQACYFLFHKWLIITPCSALCFFFLKKLFILYWGLAEYKCCNSFKWIVKGFSHTLPHHSSCWDWSLNQGQWQPNPTLESLSTKK